MMRQHEVSHRVTFTEAEWQLVCAALASLHMDAGGWGPTSRAAAKTLLQQMKNEAPGTTEVIDPTIWQESDRFPERSPESYPTGYDANGKRIKAE